MSFTQSELQSFSVLLDRKLAQQKRELERSFDQRMQIFKRDIEQRMVHSQQETTRILAQTLFEQQRKLKETLVQRLDAANHHASSTNGTGMRQQIEETIEHALDTQLVSLDQLISQRFIGTDEASALTIDGTTDFSDIEVQTEIPWDELTEIINKTLDERFSTLQESLKNSVRAIEQYLVERLSQTRGVPVQQNTLAGFEDAILPPENITMSGSLTTIQDVFASIERLEHIIESMQVTMTSNHALLSNRIYHHQQLPLERAHVRGQEVLPPNLMGTKGLQHVQKENDTQ